MTCLFTETNTYYNFLLIDNNEVCNLKTTYLSDLTDLFELKVKKATQEKTRVECEQVVEEIDKNKLMDRLKIRKRFMEIKIRRRIENENNLTVESNINSQTYGEKPEFCYLEIAGHLNCKNCTVKPNFRASDIQYLGMFFPEIVIN